MTARAGALSLAVAAVLACRSEPPPAAAPEGRPAATPASASVGPAARRYTVRGEVVRLPQGSSRELALRHEAIHDFVDRNGVVVGMNAMVMPFPVEPGVSLEGIAPGDKVRARIAVDWERNRFALEAIEELPRDTVLEFGKARPPPPDESRAR